MKSAFDSVSKPLILLYWQRLGVPLEIARWLVALDAAGYTIVRTPHNGISLALTASKTLPLILSAALGKGTSPVPSPGSPVSMSCFVRPLTPRLLHTLFYFGNQMTRFMLLATPTIYNPSETPWRSCNGQRTWSPPTRCCQPLTLRALCNCGGFLTSFDPPRCTMGRVPHSVALKTHGIFRSLGVECPIRPNNSTSLAITKQKLLVSLRALSIKRASARAINAVISKCLYK